jgi:hypothetical protein
MRKTTNPFSLLGTVSGFTKQRLLRVLRRTAGRPHRWHRQLVRRRPERFRPLTEGERNLRQICQAAEELNKLLVPFRTTRLKGHDALRPLFADADTGPTLVAQVNALRDCHVRLHSYHAQQQRQVTTWRQEWDCATAERQQAISRVHKAPAINAYVKGLSMLLEEARLDLSYLDLLVPASAPTPVQVPAIPTPYS